MPPNQSMNDAPPGTLLLFRFFFRRPAMCLIIVIQPYIQLPSRTSAYITDPVDEVTESYSAGPANVAWWA